MGEGSNEKLLLVLAVVAVAVSLLAFFFTSGFLAPLGITGYQVQNVTAGEVNVTVLSNLAIRMNLSSINFGSGTVTAGAGGVLLDSNSSSGLPLGGGPANGSFNRAIQGPPNNADGRVGGGLVLENFGNVNVSIRVRTSVNNTFFICGNDQNCLTHPSGPPNWELMYRNNFTDACQINGSGVSAWGEQQYISVNNTFATAPIGGGIEACRRLQYTAGDNRMEFHARIKLPESVPTGQKNAIITFTANAQTA